MIFNKARILLALGLFSASALGACSGGIGGSSSTPVTPTLNEADSAKNSSAAATMVRTQSLTFDTETPHQADGLVNAVGVNTSFGAQTSPYVTEWPRISSLLINSGIRHLRDGSPDYGIYGTRLSTLGAAGIKHSDTFAINVTAPQIVSALATQAPYVEYVEPMNEYDSYSGSDPNWAAHIVAEQKLLYKTVRANSNNSSIHVLGPSLANYGYYHVLGALDSVEDGGNLHDSPCDYEPEVSGPFSLSSIDAYVRTSTTYKPIWATETAYSDNATGGCYVPDNIIAKYYPRALAFRWISGEPRIYFYEFADVPTESLFGHEGFVKSDGTAKLQYYAISSMLNFLKDPGVSFSPTPLTYALSGSTQNVDHLLLQKRDGTYVLMLWLAVRDWAPGPGNYGGTPISVTPQTVTLTTANKNVTASYYQYTSGFTLSSKSLPNDVNTYSLPINDEITFVTWK